MDPEDNDEYQPSASGSDVDRPDQSVVSSSEGEAEPTRATTPTTRKRRRGNAPTQPPLKRVKGTFNLTYLHLLNEDIQDAATGIVRADLGSTPSSATSTTQVGAVLWTASEKEALFSALARLGRDDLAGLASRVRGKSALEVRQYLVLLDAYERHRRDDDGKRQRALRPVDVPAAVEVGQECGAALEAAADSLALRQEAHEAALEQKRWHSRWLVTPALAQVLDHQVARKNPQQQFDLPFAELFVLRNWLRLSDRVFMNSTVPDGNWRCVAEEAPAVRATAFADFYDVVVNVTRRLFLAAMFVAESRIRAKNDGDHRSRMKRLIRTRDVRAAVASVGLKDNSRDFWARCARRLRLDVYDESADEDVPEQKENDGDADENDRDESRTSSTQYDSVEDDYDLMSYNDIETALGIPHPEHRAPLSRNELSDSSGDEDVDESGADSDSDIEMEDLSDADADIDPAAVDQDVEEAITYSAMEYAGTARAKQAIRSRIRAEYLLEADAERFDARESAREEGRLWAMLQGQEYKDDVRAEEEKEESKKASRKSDLADLEPNWRDNMKYHSEWEGVSRPS